MTKMVAFRDSKISVNLLISRKIPTTTLSCITFFCCRKFQCVMNRLAYFPMRKMGYRNQEISRPNGFVVPKLSSLANRGFEDWHAREDVSTSNI